MARELYIVMPAFNEESNILAVVKQWYLIVQSIGKDSRLVVLDDGSTDKTYAILIELRKVFPQLIVIKKSNSGHGDTLLQAYNYCIKESVKYVFQTDSDGQTKPDEFWEFWKNRNNYDFIIGNRENRKDGLIRKFVTVILKFIIFLKFGVKVKDPNTPFRLMNVKKLAQLMRYIPQNFFLSNAILSMLIVKQKEKHLWLPISFRKRELGVNSINLKRIFKIGWNATKDFNKIFVK